MSAYILPTIILVIVIYSIGKCNLYESFIDGCKEGLSISLSLFPSILAIIFSSRIFISSGLLDCLFSIIYNIFKIPGYILSIIVLRPISFNASLSIVIENFSKYGVDSYIGNLSSILQCSMDTTFYIISLYIGFLGIKNTKNIFLICILINAIAIIIGMIITKLTL
ncbi:MAG: hypothetical protein II119_00960 [Bacilli bacterium]|nr:hypothetical protein [Bacilli bacterium]MBQ6282769.1 hypothetical protein [Bacilli bacterium]